MLGTENIKELLDYGFSLATRVKDIRDIDSPGGEKITWTEVIGSLGLITKVPKIIGDAKEAYEEWLDLDVTEVAEIKAYFADKFDLPNDRVEAIFEEVWGILLGLGKLINLLKKEVPTDTE